MRDYDKYTPKERRERAELVEELHRKRLLTDETAKKLTRTCPEAPPDTREDEKDSCQDNSVDAGVTMSQLIEAMCRLLEPVAACRAAEQAYWEKWITEDVCKRILSDREYS